jgi:hypothetical protein
LCPEGGFELSREMEVDGDAGDLAVALAVGAVDRGRDDDDFCSFGGVFSDGVFMVA